MLITSLSSCVFAQSDLGLTVAHWCGIFICKVLLKSFKNFRNLLYGLFKMILTPLLKNFLKKKISLCIVRKLRAMAIKTFKILNNMSPQVLSNLVWLRENSTHNLQYINILQIPQIYTTKFGNFRKSFRYAAAVPWNSFPH